MQNIRWAWRTGRKEREIVIEMPMTGLPFTQEDAKRR